MYSVELTPRAEKLIFAHIDYYNNLKLGLGNSFYVEIIEYLTSLSKHPELFQVRYLNVRVIPMKNFPYLMFYIIKNKTVYILAVLNSSKDIKNWPVKV